MIPLSYFVDVVAGRNISHNVERGTAREACRIMFNIFPIDADLIDSLGPRPAVLKTLPGALYRPRQMEANRDLSPLAFIDGLPLPMVSGYTSVCGCVGEPIIFLDNVFSYSIVIISPLDLS